MAARRDDQTLSLLDWESPAVVQRFAPERVRAVSLAARIAHGVSETLRDCELSREEIVAEMGAFLGVDVSINMLNAYASEAREDHQISLLRLVALVNVTRDARLLQLIAEEIGYFVAEDRYLPWVEVGMDADKREQARELAAKTERDFDATLRLARRGALR
jgi:hypothetical protein